MDSCIKELLTASTIPLIELGLFFIGLVLFVFWIAVGVSVFIQLKPPLIFRSKLYCAVFSFHRKLFVTPVSGALVVVFVESALANYSYLSTCYVSFGLINFHTFLKVFCVCLAFYLLAGKQGLVAKLDPSLKMTWDRNGEIGMHLGGNLPERITPDYILKMSSALHVHIKMLREHDIDEAIVLDSWLFLRGTKSIGSQVKELRRIIYFKDLCLSKKKALCHVGLMAKYGGLALVNARIIFRLLMAMPRIIKLMKGLPPESSSLMSSATSSGVTDEAELLVRNLASLNPGYKFESRPVSKLSIFALFVLVVRYPRIGAVLFPYSTGIVIR